MLLALVGLAAGVAATRFDFRLLVPLAAALPLAMATTMSQASLPAPPLGTGDGEGPRWWLGPSIAGLFIASELRILSWATRRGSASITQGDVSVDILIELVLTALVLGALAFVAIRGWDVAVPPVAWTAAMFPGMALLSTVWSDLPLVSLARGIQYLAATGVMLYAAGWARRNPLATLAAIERALRLLIPLLLLLTLWGYLTPSWWDGRFAWPGTHPIVGTTLLGVPTILLVASDRRSQICAPVPWWIVLGIFGVTMAQMQSRGPLVGVVLGVLAVLVMRSRRDARIAAVTGGIGMVVVAMTLLFAASAVVAYSLRGKSLDQFGTLSGRTDLWEFVLNTPIGSEVWGVGIGANRTALLHEYGWAGSAHSTWLDLLQNLGVLGIALAAATLLSVVLLAFRAPHPGAMGLAGFLLVVSITTPSFAQPGAEAVTLFLAVVLVALPVGPETSPGPNRTPFIRPRHWESVRTTSTG